MRGLAFFLAPALLFVAPPAHAQQWVMQHLQSSNPDSIVASLEAEMEEAVGGPAPSFTFQRIKGDGSETLQEYTGKTVVVNFWKTNCSGCRAQLPDLSKLQKTYKEQELRVIYISPEDRKTVTSFLANREIAGLPRRMSPKKLSRPYQFLATPSAFVVDSKGTVREVWIGPKKYKQLRELVTPYLDDG